MTQSVSDPQKIVIVGGGMIGIASAYYCRQAGLDVTLIDQGKLGAACSHGNCGLISPSHIFPLPCPEALPLGFKAMFQSNGPLRIRPGLNWSLWKWLFQFAGHCNRTDMLATGHARAAILNSSRQLYDDLILGHNLNCELQAKGCLFVYATEAAFVAHAAKIELMKQEYGAVFDSYVGRDLEDLEPALIPGSAYGAWFFADDAHLRPSRLVQEWTRLLREMGVRIIENCQLQEIAGTAGSARSLKTSQGEFTADRYVIATGAVTPFLNRHLGYQIPIQPGKGYSITMTRPEICPERPMIFEQDKVAITPMDSAFRVGSTMEFAGYDTTLNPRRLELLKRGARKYLKTPFGETVEEEWYGWRPMTPDGKAIIDYSPRFGNVLVAAGHNMLGISMAPATGKLVCELLTEQAPHIDPTPFQYPRKKARKSTPAPVGV